MADNYEEGCGVSESMLSPAEVAERVGLSRAAVYRAIDRGDLRAHALVRGRLRVEPAELEAWKERTAVAARERPKGSPMPEPVIPLRPSSTAFDVRGQVRALRAES